MKINKVTSATAHMTSEGQRISYTYSIIDDESGMVIADNKRGSMIVFNDEIIECIDKINSYVKSRIE